MGDSFKPNTLNPAGPAVAPGSRSVSIPDRRRIDSDVRAFLREPSTPWIVFDREGRPPSQLAVGEVLRCRLSSVMPEHGFFPATAAVDLHASPNIAEPSSLAVAADLTDESPDALAGSPALPAPRTGRLGRVLAVAAGASFSAVIAVSFVGLRAPASDLQPARAATPGAPVAPDLTPLDLGAAPAAPVVAPAPPPEVKRFGRLSIAGDARARDVFLDGKRLLGRGARSFTVMCGAHAIAVGTRSDAHQLDVPCNAELVVGK